MIGRSATAAYRRRAISRVPGSTGRRRSGSRASGLEGATVVMPAIVLRRRAGAHELPRVAGGPCPREAAGTRVGAMTTAPTTAPATAPATAPDSSPSVEESPAQAARRAVRLGGTEGVLAPEAVAAFIEEQLGGVDLDGKSVCIVVPDGTRTCPLPLLVGAVHRALHRRVSRMTTLIALGKHQPMSTAALAARLGSAEGAREAPYPG